MLKVQQSFYFKILNYISQYLNEIPIKIKEIIIQGAYLTTLVVYTLNCDIYQFTFKTRNIIYICCLLVIAICVYKKNDTLIQIRKGIIIPMYIIGIGALFAGIIHSMLGYIMYAFVYLLLLPFVIIALANIDKKKFFRIISKTTLLFFIIIVLCSVFFKPITDEPYASFFYDPNSLGLICICAVISGFYLMNTDEKYIYLVFIAIAIIYTLFSGSRTAQIVICLIFAIQIIFLLKYNKKKTLIALIVIAAVAFLTLLVVLIYNKSLGGFSSGRIYIWDSTIKQMNIWGHGTELVNHTNYFARPMYIHNGVLQIGYSMGIIPLIGFSVLILYNISVAFKKIFKTNLENNIIFYIYIVCSFSIYTLLYSMYSPFGDPLSFMYYIIILTFSSVNLKENDYSINEVSSPLRKLFSKFKDDKKV